MLGWMKHKLESRLLGEISITQICRWYHSNDRKWRGTKVPLDESEIGEWKSWFKIQHSKKMKIMASGPITSWQIDGETMETVTDYFLGLQKSLLMVTSSMKLKDTCSLEENLWQPRQHIKKQRHYFTNKGLYSQSYGLSSSQVHMWELDHKEELMLLNCGVGEDSWESLGLQGDKTSHS